MQTSPFRVILLITSTSFLSSRSSFSLILGRVDLPSSMCRMLFQNYRLHLRCFWKIAAKWFLFSKEFIPLSFPVVVFRGLLGFSVFLRSPVCAWLSFYRMHKSYFFGQEVFAISLACLEFVFIFFRLMRTCSTGSDRSLDFVLRDNKVPNANMTLTIN